MKYFKNSFILLFLGLILAYFIGGIYALYITSLLVILEISLSFDNAVVNAKVLETMSPLWQKRFITFGIPIAVFGMRFLFPIFIVSIASGLGIFETFSMAINHPHNYHSTLESVEKLIYAFGGAFLFMIFLDFIFDNEREEKWIKIIEDAQTVKNIGKVNNIEFLISILLGVLITYFSQNYHISLAYFLGIFLYTIVSSLDELLSTNGVRNGFIGLLYLELLDASFSFDGVIGAFALSNNIFIIMIGLGIGAMFVRSLTIYFVEQKTLTEYRYLEHGANYAIFALSFVMFYKIFFDLNELIIGSIGITFILLSGYFSIVENNKEKLALQYIE